MKPKYLLPVMAIMAMAATSCHKKEAAHPAEAPVVDVAEVTIDSVLLSKEYPGTANSVNQAEIVGRVNGYLMQQCYTNGDHVKKGQVLFKIEDTQYIDAVTQAQAALENARSAYEYATKNYAAMEKALQSDAVAQIQVLEAKNTLEQSQAAIKNAEAALQTARTNLAYCTVRAPFEGDVSNAVYSPGNYIGGAAQPVVLATIYDNSKFYCDFYVDDASYVKAFTSLNHTTVEYDSVPVTFGEKLPHAYAGKLTYVAPDVDVSTGTLMLRVTIDSPWGEVRNGMYCNIKLPYKTDPKAIMVKDASISTSQTNKFVYVVNDSNQVVYTPIEVGEMANDSMRIVTSGLNGGERYVTKALLKVRPGMEVKPVLTK